MASAEQRYTSELRKATGYSATWLPGTPLPLGTIVRRDGKQLIPISSLGALGVSFGRKTDASEDDITYQSSRGVSFQTKTKGEVTTGLPSIPKAKAGIGIEFSSEGAVVLSAEDARMNRISDLIDLSKRLWKLRHNEVWQREWLVVTHVVEVKRCTILISGSGGSKVELSLKGDLKPGGVNLADLSTGLSITSSRNMHTQMVGQKGMTPLFRAHKLHKTFFLGRETMRRQIQAAPPKTVDTAPPDDLLQEVAV